MCYHRSDPIQPQPYASCNIRTTRKLIMNMLSNLIEPIFRKGINEVRSPLQHFKTWEKLKRGGKRKVTAHIDTQQLDAEYRDPWGNSWNNRKLPLTSPFIIMMYFCLSFCFFFIPPSKVALDPPPALNVNAGDDDDDDDVIQVIMMLVMMMIMIMMTTIMMRMMEMMMMIIIKINLLTRSRLLAFHTSAVQDQHN